MKHIVWDFSECNNDSYIVTIVPNSLACRSGAMSADKDDPKAAASVATTDSSTATPAKKKRAAACPTSFALNSEEAGDRTPVPVEDSQ